MAKPLLLDSGPLGMIAHPRPNPEIAVWLDNLLASGITIILPEIADYEVRRSFLLNGMHNSLRRLDNLQDVLLYLPISTEIMLAAAQLWATTRKRGRSQADPKELNGDVILAAQAMSIDGIVVTDNLGHLTQLVEAKNWRELT